METICIGQCKCGGYGQVLNAESEKETGKCHLSMDKTDLRELELNELVSQAQELGMGYEEPNAIIQGPRSGPAGMEG